MKSFAIAILVSLSALLTNAQNCPTSINVSSNRFALTAGDTLSFVVNMQGTTASVTYNWAISNGMIVSGQGTSKILVDTRGLDGMTVTATVDLGGLPRDCMSTASSTVDILVAPVKILSGNYTTAQALTAAVQKFIKEADLKNTDASFTGYIYIYKGATTTAAQLKQIKTTIDNAFLKNNIFPHQYQIADGGKKKVASYEMYKLQGYAIPKPTGK